MAAASRRKRGNSDLRRGRHLYSTPPARRAAPRIPCRRIDRTKEGSTRPATAHADPEARSRRSSGGHIASVLLVAWSISNNKLTFISIKIPVGHIDRDALFSLGRQTIDKECKIYFTVLAALSS